MWAEGAQLRQFNMLTNLDSWYRVEVHGAIFFSGHWKCPTDFRDGVVLLHTMSVCTLYGTLDTCAAFRLGNFGPPSIRFEFGPQRFSSVSSVKGAVFRTSFHLRWRRQTCYHHVADVTGPYLLCFRDGQTSQALWHMLQPAREGRFKTEYQWRLRCVLSVSYIKTLPLTYGYCTLAFWSIFLHRLYVYNHFQNVHYSTTQANQDLAQTGLAVQSHRLQERTSRPPGHYSRTHQEGNCWMSVHLHETCTLILY